MREAFFEAGFVVLGVVLAFAANEWREARENAQAAEQALEAVIEELEQNRDAVAGSLAYHEQLIALIGGEHPAGWEPSVRDFQRGFIAPAQLQRTAWSTAAVTGAVTHMRHEQVLALSRVYEAQAAYEQQTDAVGGLIYEEIYRRGVRSIPANYRNLESLLQTFRYRERVLLEVYDGAFEEIGVGNSD